MEQKLDMLCQHIRSNPNKCLHCFTLGMTKYIKKPSLVMIGDNYFITNHDGSVFLNVNELTTIEMHKMVDGWNKNLC